MATRFTKSTGKIDLRSHRGVPTARLFYMPYKVGKHTGCPANKPFAVLKEDGAKVGCHPSRSAARQQQRALAASGHKDSSSGEGMIDELHPAPEDVEATVHQLIMQDFPQLALKRLAIAVRTTALENDEGQYTVAATGVSQGADPFDYILWFAQDVWELLTYNQREAIVFHELMHCDSGKADSTGLRPHDASVFDEEVKRYGVWWESAAALYSGSEVNWNSVNWNSVNWNSVNWNSVNWNSMAFQRLILQMVNWNSVNWNSVNWNSVNWNSETFQRFVARFVNWNSASWRGFDWYGVNWNSEAFRKRIVEAVNWNSVNWNSVNWNSEVFQSMIVAMVNWNSVNWNSVNWNSVNWNSVNWNSVNWNSVNWNSLNWNAEVWSDFGLFKATGEIDEDIEMIVYQDELSDKLRTIVADVVSDETISDKQAAVIALISEDTDMFAAPVKKKGILDHIKEAIFADEVFTNEKAAIKRENGLDFPARDYAYVPDPLRPATWQLRLTETPGKVSLPFLTRAAASLSPAGFRGVKSKIPLTVASAVKRRIRAEYRKLGVMEAEIPASVKSLPEDPPDNNSSMFIWKNEATDEYHFVGVYSNNLRDDDSPAEILTEKAHNDFANALEQGIFDYPELWHWHIKGSRWGKVEHIMVVDGFPVALGKIDKGHEAEAEAIMSMPDDYPIAMSHGMPRRYIVRNKADSTLIEFYVSNEISTLPRYAAANKYTGFIIFDEPSNKETNMPLTQQQRDFLKRVQLPDDAINGLDGLDEVGKAAGRERKELTTEATAADDAEKAAPEFVTKEDFLAALQAIASPLVEAIKSQNALIVEQGAAIADLSASLNEVKSVARNGLAEIVEMTPKASLADVARNSIFGQQSAVRLADNDPLKGKQPAETQSEKAGQTGIAFLDSLIDRTYAGANGG